MLASGTRLGIYDVLGPLGAGGMGEVYLARDSRLKREVAVKVLPGTLAADHEWRTRFVREAQVLASLNHPSIATIHGLEETPDGTRFLILERVEGDTLAARLRGGPLSVPEALDVCGQIAVGLEAAHARGVVHRDLKPGNVMVTPSGAIKLLDFGLASSAGAGIGAEGTTARATMAAGGLLTARPDASSAMGTPGYMSPEQVRGEEQDRRTDIFSFGCVLYECLSGRRAFSGKSAPEAMGAVLYTTPDFGALPGGTPSGIRTLLERCLEKDPSKRLRDIGDARMEIEAAKGTRSTRTMPVIAPSVHNLPKPRTSFVGRERELAECARLLEENRVLTLTGVGGSGKTRLGLKIAEARVDAHKDGVWFVDLAPIQDAERVSVAVATVLGVKEEPGGSLIESLGVHLTEKDALLVLDNCEHVLSACAELAEALLGASPRLRLLTTSREGLGVDGERLFAVRSLDVPRREDWRDAHAVESSDAVHLFVDRARAADSGFSLNAKNAPIIAEICRRLDGIPLAIELAAARIKVLSVEQIRSKLDDRFRLLTGGSKTALPRHQTLRATVQWSYDQLGEAERALLQALSVFTGGWTLEAATAVAGEHSDEFEILDQLTRLVDKSLVVVEREGGGEPRYRMLETVRQYAEEVLSASEHGSVIRSRHIDFYLDWAEVADPQLIGPDQGEWLARVDLELENLLAAIGWCREAPEGAVKGLRLVTAIRNYWDSRGLNDLGVRVSREALARDVGDGFMIERLKMRGALALMLQRRGLIAESLEVAEGNLALAKEVGDPMRIAVAHRGLGTGFYLVGRVSEARGELEEAIRILRSIGDRKRLAAALGALGEIQRLECRNVEAMQTYEEALALLRGTGDLDSTAVMLVNLAMVAIDRGQVGPARDYLREGAHTAEKISGKYIGTAAVGVVGALAAVCGDAARAARFWGAAAEARERMGAILDPPDAEFLERHVERIRAELGPAAFAAAERQGRAVPYESALAEARRWVEES